MCSVCYVSVSGVELCIYTAHIVCSVCYVSVSGVEICIDTACTCIDEYVPWWCMTYRSPSEWLIILLFSNRYFSIDALWKETQYTHFHNPVHSRWPISACAQCNSSYSML